MIIRPTWYRAAAGELLLLSFIGVLWVLSERMTLPFAGRHYGARYMVWCALFYSAPLRCISWRVGRPLMALNAERYPRE